MSLLHGIIIGTRRIMAGIAIHIWRVSRYHEQIDNARVIRSPDHEIQCIPQSKRVPSEVTSGGREDYFLHCQSNCHYVRTCRTGSWAMRSALEGIDSTMHSLIRYLRSTLVLTYHHTMQYSSNLLVYSRFPSFIRTLNAIQWELHHVNITSSKTIMFR